MENEVDQISKLIHKRFLKIQSLYFKTNYYDDTCNQLLP